MADIHKHKSALSIKEGITQPPNINPEAVDHMVRKKKKRYPAVEYADRILSGDRTILSQAITLVESNNPADTEIAQIIVEKCLPYSSNSVRIGITGVPGAGKSTFIETFGKLITNDGKKLAVLAIDPSSEYTRGSILGDKTRMETLSIDPNAFIRPSPAAGTLGGVARKTRESIILCEAAGFDTIIVETVGVGQSETAVSSMVDFFLLLLLAGAGDELQGIKRGIMEMADTIAITKADGTNKNMAERALLEFQTALHLYPPPPSGWIPNVLICSAVENTGIREIWESVNNYIMVVKKSGYFEARRKQQAIIRMDDTILVNLKTSFYESEDVKAIRSEIEDQLLEGKITSYKAAWRMLNKYFKK
jgi:LAO/AO transport system kinase